MPTDRKLLTILAPLPEVPILEGSHADSSNNCLPTIEVIRDIQQQYVSIIGDDTGGMPSKFVLDNGRSVIRSANGYETYAMEDGDNLWIPEN